MTPGDIQPRGRQRTNLVLVLLAALQFGACKRKSGTEPGPRDAPRSVDAAVDWARCEEQLGRPFDLFSLITACSVCDFQSIFDWSRPPKEGGVKGEKLLSALQACNAFCTAAASDRFMSALDDARGKSRTPWQLLGEACKQAVGQEPGAERFMTDALFALDRIGRTIAVHGGAAADALGKYEVVLPPLMSDGSGPGAPKNQLQIRELTPAHLTVTFLTGKIFVGKIVSAKLDASGVHIVDADSFPGVETADPNAALAELGATERTPVVLFLAPEMRASELVDVLVKRTVGRWRIASLVSDRPGTWPYYAEINTDLYAKPGVARQLVEVGPKMTIAELAEQLVRVHADYYDEVALIKAKR